MSDLPKRLYVYQTLDDDGEVDSIQAHETVQKLSDDFGSDDKDTLVGVYELVQVGTVVKTAKFVPDKTK